MNGQTDRDGWLSGVTHIPSPNHNERPGRGIPEMLVVHNISLPPGEFGSGHIEALFCNRLDCDLHPYFHELRGLEVSAHFLVERDGRVTQFVDCNERAWHAGVSNWCGRDNCNDFSIGVELEGTDTMPYSDVQYEALADLVRLLRQRYPALGSGALVGHSDIAPGRKSDPGPAFDWERLRRMLRDKPLPSTQSISGNL